MPTLVQLAVGLAVGLYRRRWQYGSFEEVKALVATVGIATLVLCGIDYWYLGVPRNMPLSTVVFGGVVGLVLMAGARYVVRLWTESRRRPHGSGLDGALILGAGDGGQRAITAMRSDPSAAYRPVGLLDDDPSKRAALTEGSLRVG